MEETKVVEMVKELDEIFWEGWDIRNEEYSCHTNSYCSSYTLGGISEWEKEPKFFKVLRKYGFADPKKAPFVFITKTRKYGSCGMDKYYTAWIVKEAILNKDHDMEQYVKRYTRDVTSMGNKTITEVFINR